MKIRITAGGIFGADGEVPVGTELTVKEEPKAWAGRYQVLDSGTEGKDLITGQNEGLTVEEYVAAGYRAENYPPQGYESRSTPEEIAAAIEAQKAADEAAKKSGAKDARIPADKAKG